MTQFIVLLLAALLIFMSVGTAFAEEKSSETPNVYFTSSITPEALVAVYEAMGWQPTGNVAVKLSTGEPPASNYL